MKSKYNIPPTTHIGLTELFVTFENMLIVGLNVTGSTLLLA